MSRDSKQKKNSSYKKVVVLPQLGGGGGERGVGILWWEGDKKSFARFAHDFMLLFWKVRVPKKFSPLLKSWNRACLYISIYLSCYTLKIYIRRQSGVVSRLWDFSVTMEQTSTKEASTASHQQIFHSLLATLKLPASLTKPVAMPPCLVRWQKNEWNCLKAFLIIWKILD